MPDVKALEEKFRSLPKGSAESNKAFKEWREAVNSAPAEQPAAESVSAPGRKRARARKS